AVTIAPVPNPWRRSAASCGLFLPCASPSSPLGGGNACARRAPGVGGLPVRFATLRRRPYRCPVPSMPLRVLPILLLVVLNTLVHAVPLLLVGLVKAVLPLRPVWRACNPLLTGLAENWIAVNTWMIGAFTRTRFELEGM